MHTNDLNRLIENEGALPTRLGRVGIDPQSPHRVVFAPNGKQAIESGPASARKQATSLQPALVLPYRQGCRPIPERRPALPMKSVEAE